MTAPYDISAGRVVLCSCLMVSGGQRALNHSCPVHRSEAAEARLLAVEAQQEETPRWTQAELDAVKVAAAARAKQFGIEADRQAALIAKWRARADEENAWVERTHPLASELYYSNGTAWATRRCAHELDALLPAAGGIPAPQLQEKKEDNEDLAARGH